jgi:uncharacterized repeat protein (TIGR03803 family)
MKTNTNKWFASVALILTASVAGSRFAAHAQPLQPEVLFGFSPLRGPANPGGRLVQDNDGNFYGTTYFGGSSDYGTVFKVTTNGTLTTLASFNGTNGMNPQAGVTLGNDGNFYGTTFYGGSTDCGTVFKVTTNGALTTLVSFNGSNGANPVMGLTLGNDGSFYGTTWEGGSSDYGTIFKVTTNGTLTTLVSFPYSAGAAPLATLTLGNDGNFYGTTYSGGSLGFGTVFQMTTSGVLTTLVSFTGQNGASPYAALTLGNDGSFYGTTVGGGSLGGGTAFKVTTNGELTTLVSFNATNGIGDLTLGKDGNFYGTTYGGGSSGKGTVFQMTANGTVTTLASFNDTAGANPDAAPVLGNDGNFYGPTYGGGSGGIGTIFKVTTNGMLTTLVSFPCNGSYPYAGLTLGSDDNFYGTTSVDGTRGYGTVFQVTTNDVLTTLVTFSGDNGAEPHATLTLGNDGNFYGTTYIGGSSDYGTVFKVTTNATLTTLASFNGTNGIYPQAGVTLGVDGNFYGTTFHGGSSDYGTVFKVTTNGTLTTLVSFANSNGANPEGALTLGSDSNFYGTTRNGGSSGYGTVFQMNTNGMLTTLVSFANSNGVNPGGALTQGSDGNFYGTTWGGGNSDYGTIFKVTTNGTLTMLVSFNNANGANPSAGLTLGADGNFYGTTRNGGSFRYGTVFQMTTNGTLATLVSFNHTNGANPYAGLTLGSDGNLYGTTFAGGSNGLGTVFRLSALAPLIVSQPQPVSPVVPVGGAITFNTSIFGALPLSYQWTFNTTNLPGATNATLTLNDVGFSSAGTYALLVTNNLGHAYSSNAVLAVLASLVTTLPVSGISATGAVLNATVTLGPNETLAWFEWGTDTAYGQIDGVTFIPGGSGTVTFSNALTGLDGDLIYHYRVVAWNSFGIVYGTDQSFQVGLVPSAVPLSVTGISSNSAALNATVNPRGRNTTVWFQWGTTTSYGNLTPATSVGSGSTSLNFSNVIAGLSWNTNYHCRVVASNSLGQVTGADVTFRFGAPLAVTYLANVVTSANAWINGRVTPNLLPTTAWFEWGTNTSYGSTVFLGDVGGGGSALSVSNLLNGLDPTMTYHFRLVASNSVRTAFGTDLQFNTSLNAYAQSVMADQPLVYFRFDETSGTLAFNSGSLGASANGTYSAAVSLGNLSLVPAFGYAAGFDNTNSDVAVPALGSYTQFTIELWARPRTLGHPQSWWRSIYTTDNFDIGALHTHFLNRLRYKPTWQLAINGNAPRDLEVGDSGLFPSNAWVHLAATYDSAARKMFTYVNGRPLATNNYNTAIPVNLAAAHIGTWIGDADENWFDGALDEFAIYGTLLPASRIQAHYQTAIGNPELLVVRTTNKLAFSWAGPGFRLQGNRDLSNVFGWTNVIGASNSPVSVTISNTGNQFFRLIWP